MGLRMPPKLADGVRRVALMAPLALIARINQWRQRQADVPNLSEAIRRLIEMALDAVEKGEARKPKGEGLGLRPCPAWIHPAGHSHETLFPSQ
jgi:hypothetical protein